MRFKVKKLFPLLMLLTFNSHSLNATGFSTSQNQADEQGATELSYRVFDRSLLRELMTDAEVFSLYNRRLCQAVMEKNYELVERLVHAGADVNNRSGSIPWVDFVEKECSPLYIAVAYDDDKMVARLIELGASYEKYCGQKNEWSPLTLAVQRNNLQQVKDMFEFDTNGPQTVHKHGLLQIATATKIPNTAMVRFLIEDIGANPNCFDHEGLTPLMRVSMSGNTELAKLILSQVKTNRSTKDHVVSVVNSKMKIVVPKGSTALHFACAAQQGETARELFLSKKIPANLTNDKRKKAKYYAKGETIELVSDV